MQSSIASGFSEANLKFDVIAGLTRNDSCFTLISTSVFKPQVHE